MLQSYAICHVFDVYMHSQLCVISFIPFQLHMTQSLAAIVRCYRACFIHSRHFGPTGLRWPVYCPIASGQRNCAPVASTHSVAACRAHECDRRSANTPNQPYNKYSLLVGCHPKSRWWRIAADGVRCGPPKTRTRRQHRNSRSARSNDRFKWISQCEQPFSNNIYSYLCVNLIKTGFLNGHDTVLHAEKSLHSMHGWPISCLPVRVDTAVMLDVAISVAKTLVIAIVGINVPHVVDSYHWWST